MSQEPGGELLIRKPWKTRWTWPTALIFFHFQLFNNPVYLVDTQPFSHKMYVKYLRYTYTLHPFCQG